MAGRLGRIKAGLADIIASRGSLAGNQNLRDLEWTVGEIERLQAIMEKRPKTADAAARAAERIWTDLSDRRGFGLKGLRYDDEDLWRDIQRKHAAIIRQDYAAEAKGG